MIFDITKVVYLTHEKELSSIVKIGTKGYFADDITDLRFCVENERKNLYGELCSYDTRENFPFSFVNEIDDYALFYPVEEPKEKKYRPYTWEERGQLRGKWVKGKNIHEEFFIKNFVQHETKFYVNGISADKLLGDYEFLDGSPCGVEIEE